MSTKVEKSEEQWREELTPDQYEVLRKKGTEAPFTGRYVETKADGTYRCAACGAELFSSDTKFESGTGWPSFWEAAKPGAVEL
nr:peptide-methionine (R)-S-oxide reductase [Thermoleophilaceae bacterium]